MASVNFKTHFSKHVLGEANAFSNKDLYNCTFPAMIKEWRRVWSENSPTHEKFPFGFVQLAPWRADYVGSEFPEIRWHQTADVGYVPNSQMEVIFFLKNNLRHTFTEGPFMYTKMINLSC
jgi:hypothetical protein